jgi:hypothetical protein
LPPGLRQAVGQVLAGRGCTIPPEPRPSAALDWSAVIRQWYRGLVLEYHPDRAGSHEAMQVINEAHQRLCKLVGL